MKNIFAKILFIILTVTFFVACDVAKRVPEDKQLLVKTDIFADNKKVKQEEVLGLVTQPNTKILKIPFSLQVYNLARPNPDSVFKARILDNPKKFNFLKSLISEKQVYRLGESFWYKGKHNLLKQMGEEPVIIDETRTRKNSLRLKSYYFNKGYFNVEVEAKTDSAGHKKGNVNYHATLGEAYIIDSLSERISSPAIDSLYKIAKKQSVIKSGEQFDSDKFDEEVNRLTTFFRNNGIYHFQQNHINYDIDTINTGNRPNVELIIDDYTYRLGDSLVSTPFEVYKISEVNIFTDNPSSRNKVKITDSIQYNNYNLYSIDKLRYKPKAITDAVFIYPGSVYADFRNNLTSRYLSNLKVFNYPTIQYIPDLNDETGKSLITNIYLSPRKKYQFGASLDFTHSNIQDFGISGNISLSIRNLFKGAETLEISARGNIGSSREMANPNDNFFNISELGADARLSFPRIFFPLNTDKIIPKNMIPSTVFSVGIAQQKNIGLDKENFTSAITYNWNPKRLNNVKFELFNIQYVKNIRSERYFNVYRSSYNALNNLASTYRTPEIDNYFDINDNLIIDFGTSSFIQDVIGQPPSIVPTDNDIATIRSIEERRKRLTENNLIVASSYSFSKSTKTGILDNEFYIFRTKLELAGNTLSLISRLANRPLGNNGNLTMFEVEFSQYVKTEFDYVKYWDFKRNNVLAFRSFLGIAIPYGNSDNIPFSRSYFAGGSNDNRAWRPYSLGPGSSKSSNDFNEANLKLAISAELRFKLFGNFRGALFADAGNIWNFLDNERLETSKFKDLESLRDIALGTGFGLRYDFSFFVIRLDLGFKTYNPANDLDKRWFREYNLKNSVLNIGINYPF
ncbi:MAG TPA: BamA/TamA family outer membrane protein [Flavobacterium sp.]|nr:BamA/TamA family outer membrane protein [Flavobacterium sp.]